MSEERLETLKRLVIEANELGLERQDLYDQLWANEHKSIAKRLELSQIMAAIERDSRRKTQL